MEDKKRNLTFWAVLAFFYFVFWANSPVANAATLRLTPGSGNFLVGSTFDLSIILDTKFVPVNLIETELFFPPDKIQITSPSVGKSIIQFWPTPPMFSNQEGRLYFAGGAPTPGINASDGQVLTLTFRVISAGEAEVRFGKKVSVLANDGLGTEVLTQTSSAFFRFSFPPPLGPAISSPTHPDQEKWYKDNNPVFIWSKGPNSEAYSFKIDHDPAGVPDTAADSSDSTVSFKDLDNGFWYFHLREKANGVWGGVSRFAVKIDNEPPAEFRINVSPSARTRNPNPILRFFTTDALSGFSHWEMKIIALLSAKADQALFFNTDSPYQASLAPGRHQIIVRAFDKAQNTRDETLTIRVLSPYSWLIDSEGINLYFIFLPWRWVMIGAGILLLVIFLAILRLWINHKHHIKHALREDFGNILGRFRIKSKSKTEK